MGDKAFVITWLQSGIVRVDWDKSFEDATSCAEATLKNFNLPIDTLVFVYSVSSVDGSLSFATKYKVKALPPQTPKLYMQKEW